MLKAAQIAVIVPAYNEQEHIVATLRSVPAFVDRVFVIDDCSLDNTSDAAMALGDSRVQVLKHAQNMGVGAALCTGYAEAFRQGADAVAVMAGDNQMHPDDLAALLSPVLTGDADYVKGDRLSHPDAFVRMPLLRFLGNHVLSFFTRMATGLRLADSQCGYTALHRRAYERLDLRQLWRGYGYPNDIIGRLASQQLRVRDVTVQPIYADEQSGVRMHHALFVVPYVLLRVLLRRIALQQGPMLGFIAPKTNLPPHERG